jgi:hypothetical protein
MVVVIFGLSLWNSILSKIICFVVHDSRPVGQSLQTVFIRLRKAEKSAAISLISMPLRDFRTLPATAGKGCRSNPAVF